VKLGRYETLSEIGRGGMGVVLRARSPEGTDVAIKLLARTDGARIARFERERRLLESLGEADGFVPVIDWAESSHGPIIVMPLLGGGTLRAKLAHGPLAIEEAIELGKTLARAVARAHERGIIHRDLKPDNVLFSSDGRPFVADLGLAKFFRADDPSSKSVSLSRTGETLGTAGYMAPEQLTDAKNVGPEADVFALGTLIYECFTGEPAFVGETAIEVLLKVERGIHESLRVRRPDLPRWIDTVIERAIAPDPGDRFRDAGELARALEAGPRAKKPGAALVVLGSAVVLAGALVTAALVRQRPMTVAVAAPPAPPKPAEPAGPTLPEICRPFARTARTKLAAVFGSYAGKHSAMIGLVLFSPDGKLGASCSLDGTVRLWSLEDGHELRTLRGHKAEVDSFAFTPDGKRIVTVSREDVLRVYDVATGEATRTFPAVADGQEGVAVTPDGRLALVRRGDELHLVDIESGVTASTVAAKSGGISAFTMSRDGARAITVSGEGAIHLWDLATGALVRDFEVPSLEGEHLAFSPDGTRALGGAKNGTTRLFDVTTGKLLATLAGHQAWVAGFVFSPDGKTALTGSFDHTMKLWDLGAAVRGADPLVRTYADFSEWVNTVAISPDGKRALAAGNDQTVSLIDLATGKLVFPTSGHRGKVSALAVFADGQRAVTGGVDRTLRVWDVATGTESRKLEGAETWITKAAVSPDGRILSGGGHENLDGGTAELILWDARSGAQLAAMTGSAGGVRSLAFSGDGRRVIAASLSKDAEKNVVEWTFDPQPASRPLPHGPAMVVVATYVLDGRPLLGDAAGALTLDLSTGPVTLEGAASPILALAAEGGRALTGKQDGTIEVWDLDARRVLAAWKSGEKPVTSVALSPDRTLGLSATGDGGVRLWDLGRAAPGDGGALDTIDLAAAGDRAEALAFLPDGRSFLVATIRGVVLRFEVLPLK
jgi:WD40 repeat protein